MADLKTYSLIINWHDDDAEQGTYGSTVRAENHNAAESMVRDQMRANLAEERDCEIADIDDEFGSVVECSDGAIWKAADMEKALRDLLTWRGPETGGEAECWKAARAIIAEIDGGQANV